MMVSVVISNSFYVVFCPIYNIPLLISDIRIKERLKERGKEREKRLKREKDRYLGRLPTV